ncbi:MAG: hypothetical protein J5852_06750, partial [Clostridia bacterium]|nr:hypothetical protein [Clostridia bacterium]
MLLLYTKKIYKRKSGGAPDVFNDIRLRRMIYRASARHDIFAFCKHDIISVPSYAAGVYHMRSIYHTVGISPVPIRN